MTALDWRPLYDGICIALLGVVAAAWFVLARIYWRRYKTEARGRTMLLAAFWTQVFSGCCPLWHAGRIGFNIGWTTPADLLYRMLWPVLLAFLLFSLYQLHENVDGNFNVRPPKA